MARLAALGVFAAAVGAVAVAFAAEGTPVLVTKLRERHPVANGNYLAWGQDSVRKPYRYQVYARARPGRAFRVSPARTRGYPGGIAGSTLVYQVIRGNRSDLALYDLASRRRPAMPRGVNTAQWEWRPSISGEWLLFSRHNGREERIVLHNLRSGAERILDSGSMQNGNVVMAGQVNGDFAVWDKCPREQHCTVFRYSITTRLSTPLPAPAGRVHYAASVAGDGTVYLARSEPRCGGSVELWRYPLVGVPVRLFSLPAGIDIAATYAYMRAGKRDSTVSDVYYDRGRCKARRFDIYRFSDVIRPPPPPPP